METSPVAPNAGARHEKRDANIRSLVMFGVGLFMTLCATIILMIKLFNYFTSSQELGPPASPFANTRALPPGPRLQVEPREDLKQIRDAQESLLHHYRWIDQKSGVVRIPIERAMELIVQRGLPVRGESAVKEPRK